VMKVVAGVRDNLHRRGSVSHRGEEFKRETHDRSRKRHRRTRRRGPDHKCARLVSEKGASGSDGDDVADGVLVARRGCTGAGRERDDAVDIQVSSGEGLEV
jgi:hypothetical protein